MEAFSMKVRKPEPGDAAAAERIRAEAERYLTAASDMAEREAGLQDLVEKYRQELERLRTGEAPQAKKSGEAQERRRQRTKRDQNPGDAPQATGGELRE